MSVTIELSVTRRWSVEAEPHYYIVVDSDADLHLRLEELSWRAESVRFRRYYGPLRAGVYALSTDR